MHPGVEEDLAASEYGVLFSGDGKVLELNKGSGCIEW